MGVCVNRFAPNSTEKKSFTLKTLCTNEKCDHKKNCRCNSNRVSIPYRNGKQSLSCTDQLLHTPGEQQSCGGTTYMTNVHTTGCLTNFNNTTGCDAPYADYSSTISTSQFNGGVVTMTFLTAGMPMGFRVWVDFNNDMVFDDPGERVIDYTSGNNNPTTRAFAIPWNATAGTHRMRVRSSTYIGPLPDPCGAAYSGEAEDYSLIVVPYSVCYGTPAPGNTLSSLSSVCPYQSFTLSLQNTTPGDSVSYQWQSSLNNISWTDISGETLYECVTSSQ